VEFSRQNTVESICFPFSRGIFPTQGSNPGLPHCRRNLHHLNHHGSIILNRISIEIWTIKATLMRAQMEMRNMFDTGGKVFLVMKWKRT